MIRRAVTCETPAEAATGLINCSVKMCLLFASVIANLFSTLFHP